MPLITIRRFQLAYESYRHAINTKTDNIFLQRRIEDQGTWESLIRYDQNGSAWEFASNKRIGGFSTLEGEWRFKWVDGDVHYNGVDTSAEALLDFEVKISQEWLRKQGEQS